MFVQLEIIIFFFAEFDLTPLRSKVAVRSAFFVSQKLFLANRVVPGLFVLVDLAFVEKALQHSLHDAFVTISGGLGPRVVFHIKLLPKIGKFLRDTFDEIGWGNARFRSGLLHCLPMLIDAGEKENFLAFKPMITRDDIGQDLFVSVTNVRRRIRVIDRRSDKKFLRHAAESAGTMSTAQLCYRAVTI